MATQKTDASKSTEQPVKPESESPRDERLEKILTALEYQAELIKRSQDTDPVSSMRRAREIVERSIYRQTGKNLWSVRVPGFKNPVEFWSDAERESEAIRDYEQRFGTRFRKNSQKDSENHEISRSKP